ncbi:GNAT family N-acetyltransferase [Deinococcus sp. KNUC1210]|uniref:GNAT family N-acetyltransferase n=1 Tax=Deinococcus sp. KNUC1210 TaxID=2917691 RepID=UPI001EF122CD|nr:GNAT family N-acetyltransferase [Deinococcus sp. KNUC1210]ULH15380.1 GNAT family N-acetyltransferase [Deinococcus sp. KNUC1210]
MIIETSRLLIVPLPLSVVRQRLETADFTAEVASPSGPLRVQFPPEWPGDPLPLFRGMADRADLAAAHSVLIRRQDLRAIGMMGVKGCPDAAGAIEIGYGLNPEAWNQGYATEALRALLPHWRAQEGVQQLRAETATSNPASARVLEKSGFVRVGSAWSEEDGDLLLWTWQA